MNKKNIFYWLIFLSVNTRNCRKHFPVKYFLNVNKSKTTNQTFSSTTIRSKPITKRYLTNYPKMYLSIGSSRITLSPKCIIYKHKTIIKFKKKSLPIFNKVHVPQIHQRPVISLGFVPLAPITPKQTTVSKKNIETYKNPTLFWLARFIHCSLH